MSLSWGEELHPPNPVARPSRDDRLEIVTDDNQSMSWIMRV